MRVAIIGGGPSGLCAARELRQLGIDCVLIDRLPQLGGRWARSSHSFCYDSLRSNISREMLGLSDFPVPAEYPDYPSRAQVLAYLHAFASAHQIDELARLGYEVELATLLEPERSDSPWRIRARPLDEQPGAELDEIFDALLVCTGPYAKPRWPACPPRP